MASPFRLNKKARRRERKMATAFRAIAVRRQDAKPEIAKISERVAELYTRRALSRRKKKPKNSN